MKKLILTLSVVALGLSLVPESNANDRRNCGNSRSSYQGSHHNGGASHYRGTQRGGSRHYYQGYRPAPRRPVYVAPPRYCPPPRPPIHIAPPRHCGPFPPRHHGPLGFFFGFRR